MDSRCFCLCCSFLLISSSWKLKVRKLTTDQLVEAAGEGGGLGGGDQRCFCSGAELHTLEKVCLQTSQLISCEWCSVRKLPVLFFQTSEEECIRLRSQLHMSQEEGGQWYDCSGDRKSAGGPEEPPPDEPPPEALGEGDSFRCFFQSPMRSTLS